MCPISLSDFKQNRSVLQIFIKISNIKYHGNTSTGSHADMRMEMHYEASRHFSRLCESI